MSAPAARTELPPPVAMLQMIQGFWVSRDTLRTGVPGSLRFFAIEELGENHYPAWEKVLHSVQTGAIAFDHVYGASKWQYMTTILKANPHLRGVLADLPHVTEGALRRFQVEELTDRCQIAAGDFFDSLPTADTYVLKWIIHDWDDERSVL